ncbi:ribonuclease M5 [Leuconostoc sp. MS02]|uniref:Ribonuclease M5 n=1 Tax=Leuconostoc aquikimchii TaxID=3236804 RepID=A0ABV3S428_9LACO
MIDRPHINEMIVVEGKSDTQNLARAVIADTIETGGSAINEDAVARAQYAAKTRGVIILTDPDFNGQRIRQIMTTAVPSAKQAYITQNEGRAHKDNRHKSLGVEHAEPEMLCQALSRVMTPKIDVTTDVDQQFLLRNGLLSGLNARKHREIVGEALHIGYTNGKQLLKRVQQFGITQAQILTVLKGK